MLEYLIGQHCATDDPTLISAGLESVRRIIAKHYVHRNQAELVKSTIKERGTHKVIDKLTVELNDKGGIWAITDVEYELPTDPKASPWQISSVKPIQVALTTTSSWRPEPSSAPMSGWTCSCRAWASTPNPLPAGASCSR